MQSYYGKAVRGQTGGLLGRLLPTPAGGYIKRLMDVLVVEDDADARAAMAKALTASGFTVTEADNGLVGLQHVSQRRFDAIVCDLRLPYLPGGAFYEELAGRDPALADRVIFVSAIAHDPAVRDFLERTGRPYLQKPYELDELIATVRRVAA
jgi:DNA-binding response OmpR family regulator